MNTPLHTNPDHVHSHFGFALADSTVLAETKVIISNPEDTQVVQLDIDPERRLKDGRKVSVVAQQMNAPLHRKEATILYGEEFGFVQYTVNLRPESTFTLAPIEGIDQSIQLHWANFAEGEYELRISLHIKTPRIAEGPLEPEQHAMVKYAQVVTVAICLFPADAVQRSTEPEAVWTRENHVFDSYGSGGFILADLPRMAKRVEALIGPGNHNLIEQIAEGDLSDTLLDEGLMAMAWGLSPWCYSIYSAPDEASGLKLSVDKLGDEPLTIGLYRLNAESKQLSIVPVNELANWPACAEKAWPVINVAGEGETLRMDLYVQICESVNGLHENPLPSFVLTRSEGRPEAIVPLIDVVVVD
ncbi:hypothetical protein JNUCC31_32105 [Paenibacillus sp. JNUCC31]|uniref:hypothetical protein n=1 Tax=Paenibacillus sp. JNUCC-31 TaxID=2777983 RepID=UPI00177D749F|nr:hypothetical protein [Paenibacillus sp. JNUCC-31]QOS79242.1 hypothetical protein JNUCC31_32105 [Paenibacillus sp. JNUCC-31]